MLQGSTLEPPMSALGHKQTFPNVEPMSALLPKADIDGHDGHVRFVPIVLQKSFCVLDHKIFEPWARF
jgi:hypothetical protein